MRDEKMPLAEEKIPLAERLHAYSGGARQARLEAEDMAARLEALARTHRLLLDAGDAGEAGAGGRDESGGRVQREELKGGRWTEGERCQGGGEGGWEVGGREGGDQWEGMSERASERASV